MGHPEIKQGFVLNKCWWICGLAVSGYAIVSNFRLPLQTLTTTNDRKNNEASSSASAMSTKLVFHNRLNNNNNNNTNSTTIEPTSKFPTATDKTITTREPTSTTSKAEIRINNGIEEIQGDHAIHHQSLQTQQITSDLSSSSALPKDCFSPRPINVQSLNVIPPPKPWIHVGLPKSGTTSLEQFWKCGGEEVGHSVCKVTSDYLIQNVFHGKGGGYKDDPSRQCPSNRVPPCKLCAACMEKAKKHNLPLLGSCGNYSAYAQMDNGSVDKCFWPQIEGLEEIHNESPNATFIYLFRNVDSWVESFLHFQGGRMSRKFKACGNPLYKQKEYDRDGLKDFVCNVVNHVRDFVATHPSHQLLEIDLENPEIGNLISHLFGIDAACWGAYNVNKKIHNQDGNNDSNSTTQH